MTARPSAPPPFGRACANWFAGTHGCAAGQLGRQSRPIRHRPGPAGAIRRGPYVFFTWRARCAAHDAGCACQCAPGPCPGSPRPLPTPMAYPTHGCHPARTWDAPVLRCAFLTPNDCCAPARGLLSRPLAARSLPWPRLVLCPTGVRRNASWDRFHQNGHTPDAGVLHGTLQDTRSGGARLALAPGLSEPFPAGC